MIQAFGVDRGTLLRFDDGLGVNLILTKLFFQITSFYNVLAINRLKNKRTIRPSYY
jgi:hypothetical protein